MDRRAAPLLIAVLLVAGCTTQPSPVTPSWVSPSPAPVAAPSPAATPGPVATPPPESEAIETTPESHPGGRWPTDRLAVALGPGPAAQQEAVREALRVWESATGGRLRFAEVPGEANITVLFVERLSRPTHAEELGDTHLVFVDLGPRTLFRSATIELLPRTQSGTPLGAVDARNLALHEIGHALGLGHSNSSTSVMAPKLPVPSTFARLPREEDAAPLKRIYAEPARPDLAVSIESASKKSLSFRTYLDIKFKVRNLGLLPAAGEISILAGADEVRRQPLKELDPGESLTLTMSNLQAPDGFRQVAVVVEPPAG
ncbi:MAG: matrixin family metalloprotease, partial [Halobacteria archaeon]